MESIGKVIDSLSAQYENSVLIGGDFNTAEFDTSVENCVTQSKGINKESITFEENGETIEQSQISESLNTFFYDLVKNLGIPQCEDPTVDNDISNPLLKAIVKYKNYPNVRLIKNVDESFLNEPFC